MSDYISADTHIDEQTKMLIFDSEGYVTGGSETWEDIHMESEIQFNGGVFGIAPRIYDTNMYMFLHLRNESFEEGESITVAHLGMQIAEDTNTLDEKTIPMIKENEIHKLEAIITKTNYHILLNGETLFNIEYAGVSKGYVGAFGTPGNALKSINVKALFPDGWTTNAEELDGAIASIERFSNMDKYFKLTQPGEEVLWLKQSLSDLSGEHQSLSLNALGTGNIVFKYKDKTHTFPVEQAEWERLVYSFKIDEDVDSAELVFESSEGSLMINDVQVEPRKNASSYIHNESTSEKAQRGKSIITYPEKENIRMDSGTALIWLNPSVNHSASNLNPVILETGKDFQISFRDNAFWFRYGQAVIFHPYEGVPDKWVHVAAKWSTSEIALYVNGEERKVEIAQDTPVPGKLINIGHSTAGQNEVSDSVINSLKLSGGNIVLNSNFSSGKHSQSFWSSSESPESYDEILSDPEHGSVYKMHRQTSFDSRFDINEQNFEIGDVYRLSYMVKGSSRVRHTISTSNNEGDAVAPQYLEIDTEDWQEVSIELEVTRDTTQEEEKQFLKIDPVTDNSSITIGKIMLTKGTEEYPWSPAPIETAPAVLRNESPNIFTGLVDEAVVLRSPLDEMEILNHSEAESPVANETSMIMRATFNHAIGNFDRSIVEMAGTPDYGSPVLIEKSDGTMMRKVSFFDIKTGEYRTYNTEAIVFPDTRNYLELSYVDEEIDTESFDIQVRDKEGNIWGMPYELLGNRLYMTIQDEEREHIDAVHFEGELMRQHLQGKYLYVTYQLKDSYTVDFNIGVPDAFRVSMGDHDGNDVTVAYEGNRHTDDKLLTMVDLNPMLNPNHEGFLYITKNVEPVTSIRASASPETLAANGATESLIAIEPLDANGNHISHVPLVVEAEYGVIIPVYDQSSVRLRDMAGRYLYRYHAPILTMEQTGKVEVRDDINIMDAESGIGIQIPMRLKSMTVVYHEKKRNDTIESISESNGASITDIAYGENMLEALRGDGIEDTASEDQVISAARNYIRKAAIGTVIEVPINHSARNLNESMQMLEMQRMAGYMAELIMHNMDKRVEGILETVDFNGDGMITIEEIEWLSNPENREKIAGHYNILRDAMEAEEE